MSSSINSQSTNPLSNSDELQQIILKQFQENDLLNLNLESLNEDDLVDNYHALRNLKFDFMESLFEHLIKHSLIDSKSENLFKKFDQKLSNILIRVKNDDKLLNNKLYQIKKSTTTNGITNTSDDIPTFNKQNNTLDDSVVSIDDTQSNNQSNVKKQKSKGEIILSSDEDDFEVDIVNLIPCETESNNIEFNSIEDLDDVTFDIGNFKEIFVNSSHKPKYQKRDYPFSEKLFSTFYNIFGLKSFRQNQLESINATMLNEDIFMLMSTGSGKSLTYQLPACLKSGVTFVISPLRSLIQDQVQKLRLINVKADTLCKDIRELNEKEIYDDLRSEQPTLKLLYVTPEKIFQSERLAKVMTSVYERDLISGFVVDECHCISSWGHDFRPDYKKLSMLKEKFKNVPIAALTATATPKVARDIIIQLKLKNPTCFIQSFNRANLHFEVKEKTKDTLTEIVRMIKSNFNRKSGIIYCLSRYESEQVAEYLVKFGIRAHPYHAGLTDKFRYQIQENWVMDKFQVVCATISFGMGIDKSDVRFVIHYSCPKSIDGFMQEAGRAGRDGKLSHSILYYNYKDIKRLFKLFDEGRPTEAWGVHISNLNSVAYFCTNGLECRRFQLLKHFGEKFNSEDCRKQLASCDNCERAIDFVFKDFSEEAKLIVKSVDLIYKNANKQFPISHYFDIYKGSNNAKIKSENHTSLPMHGKGKKMSKETMERFFRKLILEDFIKENAYLANQYDVVVAYLAPTKKGKDLLNDKIKFEFLVIVENGENSNSKTNKSSKATSSNVQENKIDVKEMNMSNFEDYCYQALLEVSNRYATEMELNQSTIISLNSIKEMATKLPKDKKEFMKIPHVTRDFFNKYGVEFLQVIQNCIKLKDDTEQLNKDVSLDGSIFIESSDDEIDKHLIEPCTSSSLNNEHKNKKLRTS